MQGLEQEAALSDMTQGVAVWWGTTSSIVASTLSWRGQFGGQVHSTPSVLGGDAQSDGGVDLVRHLNGLLILWHPRGLILAWRRAMHATQSWRRPHR